MACDRTRCRAPLAAILYTTAAHTWIAERAPGPAVQSTQVGRAFLVGDAAHRYPPTGGLGLNSAIHDAYNVCWKLAAVLRGQPGDEPLATYEMERRPVDACNVQRSIENSMNQVVVGQAMGFQRGAGADANLTGLRRVLGDAREDRAHRRAALAAIATQSMEFREHCVEYGQRYSSSAVVAECLFLFLGAGSHLFDVSALAQQSQGIDTTSAWTRETFAVLMRTVLERGLFGSDA